MLLVIKVLLLLFTFQCCYFPSFVFPFSFQYGVCVWLPIYYYYYYDAGEGLRRFLTSFRFFIYIILPFPRESLMICGENKDDDFLAVFISNLVFFRFLLSGVPWGVVLLSCHSLGFPINPSVSVSLSLLPHILLNVPLTTITN